MIAPSLGTHFLQDRPNMAPRAPQERPKSAPRAPKSVPRAPKSPPRASKSVPRTPKSVPRAPKIAPRASEMGHKFLAPHLHHNELEKNAKKTTKPHQTKTKTKKENETIERGGHPRQTPKRRPKGPKSVPRAPKSRPRGAGKTPKPLQNRLRSAPGPNFRTFLAKILV